MGALERVSWLLLLLANSLALAKVLEPDRQYDTRSSLEAGVPLQQVELPMSGGQALYELKGLKKQQGYEVKISFPGTVPATYHIELVGEEREDTRAGRRRLLDTEKLVFTTDDSGRPLRGAVPVQAAILVTVQPLGLVVGGRKPPTTAIFNIELEELEFGIPRRSWWVAALAVLSLVAVVLAMSHVPERWLIGQAAYQIPKAN